MRVKSKGLTVGRETLLLMSADLRHVGGATSIPYCKHSADTCGCPGAAPPVKV